ncbi:MULTISPECIES: energy-coupling factor transporter transmembrane component T family protein [Bacillaceae]|uniref:Energy-coupling factor transporter transmembrane protein EcfT n=1 Tax=Evansella alkalicola TaxID=745819 RepID=A0ABS6JSE4_9BACI|nr:MULTISPECIES: energy-coupling factor transporter transmembrane component T [Bacillaceae]MBU9720192.1 energy-coupling factor transporter transmembrane protein EcfT [Bacillus alkalicola]
MLEHIALGQYLPGSSVLHRLDPRSKLVGLLIFMLFLFISRHPLFLVVAIGIFIWTFSVSKVPLIYFFKSMRLIGIIIFITLLLQLFMNNDGEVLFQFFSVTVYSGGLTEGLLIGGRLFILVGMASLLTLTTTPVDLTDGLETLFSPLKKWRFPVHEMAFMISIALRFFPTLIEETARITKAQMARGASFSHGSPWKRVKTIIPIFVPLIVQSLKRAEELAVAMEARGYVGGEGRTKYRQLYWKGLDTLVISIITAYAVLGVLTRLL